MTVTRFDTGDPAVDQALAGLADDDPTVADLADDGFTALTWGRGLPAVSLRGLQDYLWYQLPYKHGGTLAEHRATRTTIVMTVSPLLLHHADQVAFLEGGRVTAVGTHEELLAGNPAYRRVVVRSMDEEVEA